MYIPRNLSSIVLKTAEKMPIIGITGPRQSGKSTLCRKLFPEYKYISFENTDTLRFAQQDPRDFLKSFKQERGVIFDEVQYVGELLSYIQTDVDLDPRPGFYILTGSQNFVLTEAISQSLAGRIALFELLPFSFSEVAAVNLLPEQRFDAIYNGFYPRVIVQQHDQRRWYQDYIKLYVQRDVRLIKNITDLDTFELFIQMCAGRIGQLLNVSSLASDCGISAPTAKSWLKLLETSYIIFQLHPYYNNFSKRLVKMPKLYFYDTGLACALLGITSAQALRAHYLRGGLFESMIISELFKEQYNQGWQPRYYFWRDHHGHEIDCLRDRDGVLLPIEIKYGTTINNDFFDGLLYWNDVSKTDAKDNMLIYGGNEVQRRSKAQIVSWDKVPDFFL